MNKQTILQQYHPMRTRIENYCRKGDTCKVMAKKLGVTPARMKVIIKTLDISIIKLREEG